MKKIVVILGILCFILTGVDASFAKDKKKQKKDGGSQIVDIAKCTCEDMLNADDEQLQKAALIWIDGYTSARSGDTKVSLNELDSLAKSLERFCKSNPSMPILDAARKSKGR